MLGHYHNEYQNKVAKKPSLQEIKFIRLKSKCLYQAEICRELNISIGRYEVLEDTIFLKLKENNWFGTIRIAYLYGILQIENYNALSSTGDMRLFFSTDDDDSVISNNGLVIAPYRDLYSPFGIKFWKMAT